MLTRFLKGLRAAIGFLFRHSVILGFLVLILHPLFLKAIDRPYFFRRFQKDSILIVTERKISQQKSLFVFREYGRLRSNVRTIGFFYGHKRPMIGTSSPFWVDDMKAVYFRAISGRIYRHDLRSSGVIRENARFPDLTRSFCITDNVIAFQYFGIRSDPVVKLSENRTLGYGEKLEELGSTSNIVDCSNGFLFIHDVELMSKESRWYRFVRVDATSRDRVLIFEDERRSWFSVWGVGDEGHSFLVRADSKIHFRNHGVDRVFEVSHGENWFLGRELVFRQSQDGTLTGFTREDLEEIFRIPLSARVVFVRD